MMKHKNKFSLLGFAPVALVSLSVGCSGAEPSDDADSAFEQNDPSLESAEASNEGSAVGAPLQVGQVEQPLWWSMPSSCSDPTGTDSVLAAIAVASARELRRWNPVADFYVSGGTLKLTTAGKSRCADGVCYNTQALLDLQKDAASSVYVRPGVRNQPSTLRIRLTWNHGVQVDCSNSFFNNCASPDHQFTFVSAEPGGCDTNYTFKVTRSSGAALTGSSLASTLSKIENNLIWLDDEDNSYIRFDTEGDTMTIDPTYGLNEGTTSTAGACAAACTMVSQSSIAGRCCTCSGTKTFKRSAWNANTYLCQ
jgi:hypothetical protein